MTKAECFNQRTSSLQMYGIFVNQCALCRDSGILFAVASRTPTPHVARAFLDKLGVDYSLQFSHILSGESLLKS